MTAPDTTPAHQNHNFGAEIPFVRHLGFALTHFEGGESAIAYRPEPHHLNSFSVTHGGAVMTLLDVTMATAARSVQKDMGAVTIEMKTSFMQPAPGDGTELVARGRLIHRTATLAFTEATLFDAQGRACAHATGTFKYVKRLPVGSKNVNDLNPERAPQQVSTD
jgi:uncharacterized protein (TIGR00369 family)